jgi:hypothetical protein
MSLRLEGYNGCELVHGTGAHTSKNFEVLAIQEDTVIASMTGVDESGTAVDFKVQFNTAAIPLKAGALLTCIKGQSITAITLTSGTLIGYNKV